MPPWPLHWRHNERDCVSNHQHHDRLLNRLFKRRSKKTSKLRVTGLCEGNSPVTGEFPARRASNAENVSIWWRHHDPWLLWNYVNNGNTSMTTDKSSLGTLKSGIVMTSWYGNVTLLRSFGVFFDTRTNNLRIKEWDCRWLETPRGSCDVTVIYIYIYIYIYSATLIDFNAIFDN